MKISKGVGVKIGVSVGRSETTQPNIALKDNDNADYINAGIGADMSQIIEITGRFTFLGGNVYMGANGTNARYFFGLFDGSWVFGVGSSSAGTSPTGSDADTDVHTFKLDNGKLYVDEVLEVDKSSETLATSEPFGLHSINFLTSASALFELHSAVVNGVEFTPHKDGYYVDNLGNKYYNRGEASNLYPLEVINL